MSHRWKYCYARVLLLPGRFLQTCHQPNSMCGRWTDQAAASVLCSWNCRALENASGCLQVFPSGGELAARSEVKVTVEFAAVVKKELSEVITLEVRHSSCWRRCRAVGCMHDGARGASFICGCDVGMQPAQLACLLNRCGCVAAQMTDLQGVLGVVQSTPITIKGEAYKIEMDIKFPQEGLAGVDFGVLRWVAGFSSHGSHPCCGSCT